MATQLEMKEKMLAMVCLEEVAMVCLEELKEERIEPMLLLWEERIELMLLLWELLMEVSLKFSTEEISLTWEKQLELLQ